MGVWEEEEEGGVGGAEEKSGSPQPPLALPRRGGSASKLRGKFVSRPLVIVEN